MRRDYVKAVNFINSCHKFVNTVIEKNNTDKANLFLLPMVTNFVPLFPYLVGKKPPKREKKEHEEIKKISEGKISSDVSKKTNERKTKSSFGVVSKAPSENEATSIDPAPVGDCEKNIQLQKDENKYTNQATDIVKEQIHQFMSTLQDDIVKATRERRLESPEQKCRNLDIVKQRLQELSKICCLQKDIKSNSQIVQFASLSQPPLIPTQNKNVVGNCNVIMLDTNFQEAKNKSDHEHPLKITGNDETSDSKSECSDIKSDSDTEINNES
ncbi:hypothetical protein BDFB_003885 [Asbolus verrucosus]|uniref:Uncharacterized protein n=1 Tax=Asbolus verrucosus TaxID=1661398 RepID=A0A482W6R2_ASBVE|nr:hypothetical protein BDFB_003885 [Asbolus verrucosus]